MRRVFPVQGYSGAVALHWGQVPGGSDIMAPAGSPVVAMVDGVVLSAGWGDVGGWNVTYQGDDGLVYYCAHFDRQPVVGDGQRVRCGDYLAGVGDTGNAAQAGPHLHIGIGPEIVRGTGPYGGTGGDFDAVGLLRTALAGATAPVALPGFDFEVAEQAIANATRAGLPPLLMLGLAHGAGGLKRPFPAGDGGRRHGPYQIDGATYPGYAAEYWWESDNVYAVPEIVGRWKRSFAAHGSWKAWWYDHYSFIHDWAPAAQESDAWSDEKAHHCIGHALDTFVLFQREQQRRSSTQPAGPDPRDARIAHLEALVREAAEQQETAAQRLWSALG